MPKDADGTIGKPEAAVVNRIPGCTSRCVVRAHRPTSPIYSTRMMHNTRGLTPDWGADRSRTWRAA